MSTRGIYSLMSPVTFSGCAGRLWICSGWAGGYLVGMPFRWRGGRRWRGWMSLSDPNTDGQALFGSGVRDQDRGDVVGAAGLDREPHHVAGGAERVGQGTGQGEPGYFGRLGPVVPQAVGAHEQDPRAGRRMVLHVRG